MAFSADKIFHMQSIYLFVFAKPRAFIYLFLCLLYHFHRWTETNSFNILILIISKTKIHFNTEVIKHCPYEQIELISISYLFHNFNPQC